MTNGEALIVRAAIKPISTLTKPLRSVDTETKEATQAAARAHRLDRRPCRRRSSPRRWSRWSSPAPTARSSAATTSTTSSPRSPHTGSGSGGGGNDKAVRPAARLHRLHGRRASPRPRAGRPRARASTACDADELIEAELGEPIAELLRARGRGGVPRAARRSSCSSCSPRPRRGHFARAAARSRASRARGAARPRRRLVPGRDEDAWERSRDSRPAARRATATSSHACTREREPLYEAAARRCFPRAAPRSAPPRRRGSMRCAPPRRRLVWAASDARLLPGDRRRGRGRAARGAVARERPPLPGRATDDGARHHAEPAARSSRRRSRSTRARSAKTLAEAEARAARARRRRRPPRRPAPRLRRRRRRRPRRASARPPTSAGSPVVQVPTTLVAQVDSAYGGKTGVDLPEAKNYVGAYHLPLAVIADPATLGDAARGRAGGGLRRGAEDRAARRRARLGAGPRDLGSLDPARAAATSSSTARGRRSRSSPPTSATPGAARVAQPRPHRRPRDRGRERLRALPPRRGRRPRAARGAAALRRRRAARRGRRALERHGLPTSLDGAIGVDDDPRGDRARQEGDAPRARLRPARAARRGRAGASGSIRVGSAPPWRSCEMTDQPGRGAARGRTSTCSAAATPSTTGTSRLAELERPDQGLRRRARAGGDVLPDQPRGRVHRAPAPAAGGRRRRDRQRRGLDALQLRDPRRARARRAARGRGPPLRRDGARGVAPPSRSSTASVSARRLGQGARGLPRGAGDAEARSWRV